MKRNSLKHSRQYTLLSFVILGLFITILLPIMMIFYYSLKDGFDSFINVFDNSDILAALILSFKIVATALPINIIASLAMAWLFGRFQFPGRSAMLILLDLPFAISPIVVGLLFMLAFSPTGIFGQIFAFFDIKIIYAFPGLVLVSVFVSSPFIARELIPMMEQQKEDFEEVALTLGAKAWKMFLTVTIPSIKWGLVYGVILTATRIIGEFGSVSIVSGNIRGETNTLPLLVQLFFYDNDLQSAYSVSLLLTLFALAFVILRLLIRSNHNK